MTFFLPKRTILLWQIRVVVIFLALCIAPAFLSRYYEVFYIPTFLLAIIGLAITLLYLPLYLKTYKITVEQGSICITKGVIVKTTNVMPYPRLVFARTFSSPLATMFKLKCVVLKAARAWMVIPEIDNLYADHVIDNIRVKSHD